MSWIDPGPLSQGLISRTWVIFDSARHAPSRGDGDVAHLADQERDAKRAAVVSHTADEWMQVYANTKLATHLNDELMLEDATMAFGALHVLVPPAAEARALEHEHQTIRHRFTNNTLQDAEGNRLRISGRSLRAKRGGG